MRQWQMRTVEDGTLALATYSQSQQILEMIKI